MEQLAQRIADAENTRELREYWQKRFEDLLSGTHFQLDQATVDALNALVISHPITPRGYLVLDAFVTGNHLNEHYLQQTVEVAVRLLDNILDILPFEKQAAIAVRNYRKIAIGITHVREFLEARGNESDLEEIDYIGNIISNSAYRASESIADEKGPCLMWDSLSTRIRPKTFEFWFDQETGDVVDGLTMSERYDPTTIAQSNYRILPRRNSHILDYPKDADEWLIWSDRDPVKIDQAQSTTSRVDLISDTNPHPSVQTNTTSDIEEHINKNPIESTTLHNEPIFKLTPNQLEHSDTELLEHDQPQLLDNHHHEQQVLAPSTDNTVHERSNLTDTRIDDEKVEQASMHEHNVSTSLESIQPIFQVGELVVIDADDELDGQTAQIIDVQIDNDKVAYVLRGSSSSITDRLWYEEELKSVDLFALLDKVNTEFLTHNTSSEELQAKLTLLIENPKGNILVHRSGPDSFELPSVRLPANTIPEHIASRIFAQDFKLGIKNIQEIGSSVEFAHDGEPFTINLCFTANLTAPVSHPELTWIDMRTLQFTSKPWIRVLCNKYQRFKIGTQQRQNLEPPQPVAYQASPSSGESAPTQRTTTSRTLLPMSTYILKLQQLIDSSAFGPLTASIELTTNGPRITSIEGEGLSHEIAHIADVMVTLINAMIAKGSAQQSIINLLRSKIEEGSTIQFDAVVEVIIEILRELPENIENMTISELITGSTNNSQYQNS